ncbi:MAG TPA: C-GCAxxG-C-C family protein [Candidatus Omnitrophota bacterium]|nr:C-GCAxxG-C-C family protein [Candidatus Omnitrophota bacterium]
MKKVDDAVFCFKEGFSCSQAILSAYGKELGIDNKTALKIASAFGGGMARMGETCGAVTGAFMVIGLKYAVDKNSKDKVYAVVKEFVDGFKARNRSIVCKELLGYDMSTPEGMNAIKEKKLVGTICPKLVKDAAEILEQIL